MQDVCIFYDLIAFFLVRPNAARHLSSPRTRWRSKIASSRVHFKASSRWNSTFYSMFALTDVEKVHEKAF